MIVYKATNCLNNKVYFCVTGRKFNDAVSMKISTARAKPKKMKLKDDYKGKSPFSKAILRHGEYNFKFEILHSRVSKKKAYDLKKKYIKEYDAMNPEYGYNCTTGGIDFFNNADHVIERQIEAQTGKTMPESYVELMKERVGELHPHFGMKHSKQARENMRQGQLNSDYVPTEETKQKTSASAKKMWEDKEFKEKMIQKHKEMGRWKDKKNPMYGKGRKGKNNPMYGRTGALSPNYGKKIPQWQKDMISKGNKESAKKRRKLLIEKYKNRTEKKCVKCKKVKPLDMFVKSKKNLDGHIANCKPCERVRNRERYYRLHSPNKIKNRFGKLIKDVIKESK